MSRAVLFFVAALLITNSHLDALYPVPQLAFGGALGNSIFFLLSGYGLVLADERRRRPFFQWYLRRASRIYPSVAVVVAGVTLTTGSWRTWSGLDYVNQFIWPTPFWFVAAIMLFYAVFFTIARMRQEFVFAVAVLVLFIPYFYVYLTRLDLSYYSIEGPGYFKWIFYLQVMLFGGYLAFRQDRLPTVRRDHLIVLGTLLVLYGGFRLAMYLGWGLSLQWLMQALVFPILYLALLASRSDRLATWINGSRVASVAVPLIAGVTLEIYLIQYHVYTSSLVVGLVFPLNVILFCLLLVVASVATARIAGGFRSVTYMVFSRSRAHLPAARLADQQS